MRLSVHPAAALQGVLRPPSDKSLTHRAYMLAAIADGESEVTMPLRGEDCEATLRCLNQLGLRHEWLRPDRIRLIPCLQWQSPRSPLDCGNSGTTMRLLAGLVASRPLEVEMIGDASLTRRPMRRIAEPLIAMGAAVEGERPPLRIRGAHLKAIDYRTPVPSAQIKSCVLLAGLRADGETSITEEFLSRDHTERMLAATGVPLVRHGLKVSVSGGACPRGFSWEVPADISAAAFFLVGAAMLPQSQVLLTAVGTNPTRSGVLDVLHQCGVAYAESARAPTLGEPVSDVEVRGRGGLRPFKIGGSLVPRLIDEIPILAILATQCEGTSEIRDAGELRVKESDRIESVCRHLAAMGAEVEATADGMVIQGPTRLRGTIVDAAGDHRIAMAFAIAGLVADGETQILGADSIATSYPDFERDLRSLTVA